MTLLFSTEEERQEASAEKVTIIPIDKITDFKEHPFHVTMDEDMAKLIDSIKEKRYADACISSSEKRWIV